MAYDKVVDSTFLDGGLTLIADAIREKNGSEDELLFPDDFVTAITAIEGGGGSEDLGQYIYYYNNGASSPAVGTWSGINIRSDEGWANGSFATTAKNMIITVNNSSYGFGATNKLDLSLVSELRIVATAPGFVGGDYDQAVVWISSVRSTATNTSPEVRREIITGTNVIDVSSLSGSYYIVIDAASDYSRTLTISEIYGVVNSNTKLLYYFGDTYENVTGGWTVSGSASLQSGYINCVATAQKQANAYTTDLIDLAPFTTLHVTITNVITDLFIGVPSSIKSTVDATQSGASHKMQPTKAGTHTLDISSVNGSRYVWCGNWSESSNSFGARVTAAWLT